MKSKILPLGIGAGILLSLAFSSQSASADAPGNSPFQVVQQQSRKVSGTIKDSKGEGLPGVSVRLKSDSSVGTITDISGAFQLQVPSSETVLLVSSVGYKAQEVNLAGRSVIDISLDENVTELEELVVIGYGEQKKSDLTGAVTSVKGAKVNKIAATNVTEMLQGNISGARISLSSGAPGASPQIQVRGTGSFGGGSPLYIIDGVQGSPEDLNPDDIASFEILKDAASAAIYGTQGADGVILITTKSGTRAEKLKIDVNTFSAVSEDIDQLSLVSGRQWREVQRLAYENDARDTPASAEAMPDYIADNNFDYSKFANTDWQDALTQKGHVKSVSVGVSGGGKMSNYRASVQYQDIKGVMLDTDQKKYNFRLRGSFGSDKLRFTPTVSYTFRKGNQETYRYGEARKLSPLMPIYDDSRPSGYGFMDSESGYNDFVALSNVVGEAELKKNQYEDHKVVTNIGMVYNPIKDLTISSNFGVENRITFWKQYAPQYQLGKQERNLFAYLTEKAQYERNINADAFVTYKKSFGDHNLKLMAGATYFDRYRRAINVHAQGKNSEDEPAGFVDPLFQLLQPTLSSAGSDATYSASGGYDKLVRVGLISRFNYDYKGRYLLQATIRRDASSKFGRDTRWGNFPSVSAGWKISEEEFFQPASKYLNFLKLRASYGLLGREKTLGLYTKQALVYSGYSHPFGTGEVVSSGSFTFDLENLEYRWEKSISKNIGIDFESLEGQLYGEINYYNNDTEDLLARRGVPSSAGINDPIVNVASLTNKGWEFELGYRKTAGDFTFDVKGNLSFNRSEITKLTKDDEQMFFSTGTVTESGYSIGHFYLIQADGIFQNQQEIDNHKATLEGGQEKVIQPLAKPGDVRFVDKNNDGIINADDREYLGRSEPGFVYGLSAEVGYKGFDLSVLFYGEEDRQLINFDRQGLEKSTPDRNYSTDLLDAWSPSNTGSSVPRLTKIDLNNNNRLSSRWLEDASFLRVKNIRLGYSVPKSVLNKVNVQKLRVYVSGENLFTFTDFTGVDPEAPIGLDQVGGSGYRYPVVKKAVIGLQLTF
ncbi:SusC/RagA family TonB-linked outer membrane protein (plasmid) [Fulvitalea axinellae]|uniref:SusC/RagA family TonB-linked outer membrane protein n=1 Tax=Fulvitalea axinellae TaxID=1182444 RepID=A0AAU9CPQ4_9BACT|nr:SusC/RagA family TonB-linked outer membrane protein [Fulvitalea axinellae]